MKAPTLKMVQRFAGVDEYRLSNGLRLLYKHDTAAPVAAVCVTYHVGSRNEAKGHTGSTHILEHLLFKDTEHFKSKEGNRLWDVLERLGALLNATTWLDRTQYFELVPKEKVEIALAIEADRMRTIAFTADDLKSEMTVVRNEYERGRNNPFELLDEAIMQKAFVKHPYRIPTIGTKEDIEASNVKKLYEFYNTFYWPNNATLMVAGDVPFSTVKKLVLKHFGPIQSSPKRIPALKVKEPPQKEPRKVVIEKDMGVAIAQLTYKVPERRHKDFVPLYMAATMLGTGYASRLQAALVDTGLAASATVFCYQLHDPGVFSFVAHSAAQAGPGLVLDAMRETVQNFVAEGPTKEDLALAKERILAELAEERDGVFKQVRVVSEAVAAGDWRVAYTLEQDIEKVTLKDIQRLSKKYFSRNNETAGILQKP